MANRDQNGKHLSSTGDDDFVRVSGWRR